MSAALVRHDHLLGSAVAAQGGHVVKNTGDGMLAVFSTPDAALAAAVDVQRALSVEEWGAVGSFHTRA